MPGIIIASAAYQDDRKRLAAEIEGSGRIIMLAPVEVAANMTFDNNWHDLDCSSYVPANSEGVVLSVYLYRSGDSLTTMELRQNGNNTTLSYITSTPVSSNAYRASAPTVIMPLDDDLIFEYKGPSSTTTKYVYIYGYLT